jgi:predicted flap endonuclease-1-like 5' DNA nuclease
VPTDDLSSISGLEDKHLRVLARQQITDLRSLAHADQRAIYKAMANFRPRPSLERISRWQGEARSRLEKTETDSSDWQTVASFAVIFRHRQVGDAWERRVEVERTEVEPEQEPGAWAGWDFEPVGSWMGRQLAGAESASTPAQPVAAAPAAAQSARTKAPERSQLRIDRAALIDANRAIDVVTEGVPVAELPAELVAPVRVVLTVSGARPGRPVHAVTRILRPDGPGWNPQDPVVIQRPGQTEFDLSGVPAGQYEMSLIAWAPDGTARPVSVKLPALTIRSASG